MAKSSAPSVSDSPAIAPDALSNPGEAPAKSLRVAVRFQGAVCPTSPAHDAKVYKTDGKTRHCKCNDCGATWKQIGEHADPLKQLCEDLVKMLEKAEPVSVEPGMPKVILVAAEDAEALTKQLRGLLAL
jgi:hypothetical protein